MALAHRTAAPIVARSAGSETVASSLGVDRRGAGALHAARRPRFGSGFGLRARCPFGDVLPGGWSEPVTPGWACWAGPALALSFRACGRRQDGGVLDDAGGRSAGAAELVGAWAFRACGAAIVDDARLLRFDGGEPACVPCGGLSRAEASQLFSSLACELGGLLRIRRGAQRCGGIRGRATPEAAPRVRSRRGRGAGSWRAFVTSARRRCAGRRWTCSKRRARREEDGVRSRPW